MKPKIFLIIFLLIGTWSNYIYACHIDPTTVISCSLTECYVNEPVLFDATGSYKNDASLWCWTLVHYNWDFQYYLHDDFYIEQTTTSGLVLHTFSSPGTYKVAVECVDRVGKSGGVKYVSITVKAFPWGSTSTNMNWIAGESFLKPVTDENYINYLKPNQRQMSLAYSNGFGKLIQTINVHASPEKDGTVCKNIVVPVIYDKNDVQAKSYLPYVMGSDGGNYQQNAETEQALFYQSAIPGLEGVKTPSWSEKTYEHSPAMRTLEESQPGYNINGSNRHTRKYYDAANAINEVRLWSVVESNNNNSFSVKCSSAIYYPANSLSKNSVEDENAHIIEVFKDKSGKEILKRTIITINGVLTSMETYSIFDDYGNLRFVLSPEVLNGVSGEIEIIQGNEYWKKGVTEYRYDGENRLIEKYTSEAEPMYNIYDPLGRLILKQDGEMRKNNAWAFTKYDLRGRAIISGVYTDINHTDRASLQAFVDENIGNNTTFGYCEEPVTLTGDFSGKNNGYTNTSFPDINSCDVWSITYFDDYDFNRDGQPDAALETQIGFSPVDVSNDVTYPDYTVSGFDVTNRTIGYTTRTIIKVFDNTPNIESWNVNTMFYDKYGRVIQTKSQNYAGWSNTGSTQYDFSGKTLRTKLDHTGPNGIISVMQRFTYDDGGRPIYTYHYIKNKTDQCVSKLEYNSLGQVIKKSLYGSSTNCVNYSRNIRGWLMQVNDPFMPTSTFAYRLFYDEPSIDNAVTLSPRYDGTITGMTWCSQRNWNSSSSGDMKMHASTYLYDQISRLTGSTHAEKYLDGGSWLGNNAFTEKNINYDLNGNILALQRYDALGNLADNLIYTYSTTSGNNPSVNKLTNVTDQITTGGGAPYFSNNGITDPAPYNYDDNGNLVIDKNKGLSTIKYNYLNLPVKLTWTDNSRMENMYAADGTKTRVQYYLSNGTLDKERNYFGGFEYEKAQTGNLSMTQFPMSEGRITCSGGTYAYEYQMKDHLGNVRTSFTVYQGSPVIQQEDYYYPFGLSFRMKDVASANRYLYNGKEIEDFHNLGWNDYSARFYDPQLGRWHAVDPMAQHHSPYIFCNNDPINRIDVNGKWDIKVYVYQGYGVSVLSDRNGKEMYRWTVRVQGIAGSDRTKTNADTPYGTYDIPDRNMWESKDNRASYGPNQVLRLHPLSGEIVEKTVRDGILMHGGRQEVMINGEYSPKEHPALNKTKGCIRAFDSDMLLIKKMTTELQENDPFEHGGTLEVTPSPLPNPQPIIQEQQKPWLPTILQPPA